MHGPTVPGAVSVGHTRAEPESASATAAAAVMVTAKRRLAEAAAALLVCVLPPKKTMVVPLLSCCGNPAACGFCPVDFTLLHANSIQMLSVTANNKQYTSCTWYQKLIASACTHGAIRKTCMLLCTVFGLLGRANC